MNCHAAGNDTMAGLPDWAFWTALSVSAILTLSSLLGGHRWFKNERLSRWRFDLTRLRPFGWLVKRRSFQFVLQIPLVLALGLILFAGFRGTPVSDKNAATVLTWTFWWTLLILDIVLLGRMWCLVCPWEAIAAWIRRLAFWRRTDEPLALNLKWPRWLRNVYPATVLFVGLTWLELGWGVTMSPRATATLGLCMVMLAVLPALFFERRSFCKYGCLIGRICGLYSMVAPVEVRARDGDVCRSCKTKDCYNGNKRGYPCPTGLTVGALRSNTYCTVCTECMKTCPHDNVALNVRPWGADLHGVRKPRRDEAILAIVMLSLTSFHGLTMTPIWWQIADVFQDGLGVRYLGAFSIGMALILLAPALVYLAATRLADRLRRPRSPLAVLPHGGFGRLASAYAYPLVAIALMYHLAHNAGHFLTEAGIVVPLLSDPFGAGDNWFGTAAFSPSPLASMPTIWAMMIALVLVGHWIATRAMERAHRHLASEQGCERMSFSARAVMGAFVWAATAVNLWLLAQPMEMRSGM